MLGPYTRDTARIDETFNNRCDLFAKDDHALAGCLVLHTITEFVDEVTFELGQRELRVEGPRNDRRVDPNRQVHDRWVVRFVEADSDDGALDAACFRKS